MEKEKKKESTHSLELDRYEQREKKTCRDRLIGETKK